MPWTISDVPRFKKGLTDKQKKQWVAIANSARKRCIENGGSEKVCDASAIKQANGAVQTDMSNYAYYIQSNNYSIRSETYQGKRNLVMPAVMMVEGVHNGSHGPILHTKEELEKFPEAWNGIPVMIQHPEKDGHSISANSPDLIDSLAVGRVYNTLVEDGKLKGEVWLDEEKLKQVSPLAYGYIMQQHPLDVSVGVFTDDDFSQTGEWNGEKYSAVARNYRPDHLALLPGGKGACSWEDGCGIRTNQADLTQEINLIRHKLDSMEQRDAYSFLEAVYDDGTFIYRVDEKGGTKYFRNTYQIKDGEVVFGNNEEEVEKEIKYKPILIQGDKDGKTKGNKFSRKGGKDMNKVKELLTIAPSVYAEDDKEWLDKLEEAQVDKLLACAKANSEVASAKESIEAEKTELEKQVKTLESKMEEMKKGTPQINEEAAMKVLKEKVSDIKTFGELLPDELRRQFDYGQKLYEAHRQELIKHIMDNQAEKVWDEKSLGSMTDENLQKIADSIKKPADYSAAGGVFNQGYTGEILLPPGVNAEEKK